MYFCRREYHRDLYLRNVVLASQPRMTPRILRKPSRYSTCVSAASTQWTHDVCMSDALRRHDDTSRQIVGERGRERSPLDAQDSREANDIRGVGAISLDASTAQVSVVRRLCVRWCRECTKHDQKVKIRVW